MNNTTLRAVALALGSAFWLAGCGGGNDAEEARAQDTRSFTAPNFVTAPDYEADTSGAASFKALAGTTVQTDRWTGVLNGAGYRIEVPRNWNGRLVMYAHGYVGTVPQLAITTPSIRRYLIENGYAWAASSYSKNYYDVRAGVEDTNALALNFASIAASKGRTLSTPSKTYIIGHSMGGHITGAAIEDETFNTAKNKMRYDGAVPMCGVMGDTELFDYFAGYQLAAQTLAGQPNYPMAQFADIAASVRSALFTTFSTVPTAQGAKLAAIVKNLTGGERPVFAQGFGNTALQSVVWGTFGSDGTVNGILTKSTLDTNRFTYQLDSDPAVSAEETALNASIPKLTGTADANRLRSDGLRWIPKVNGQFHIPVVSLHTLGDMYVPFSMEQIYRRRTDAAGNGGWLVQRAIRAPSHCDFTVQEQVDAFSAMVAWAESGVKPAGDDVLTAATVASPTYGCTFTKNTGGTDDNPTTINTRTAIAPQLTPCP
ncbi:alpha/beta hydrolase [Noviherbaspirillum sp.]|uniref:alpha/beta hydrolase n=1 Tax=Noviherbaspirillum sp. TaxID=1926288 RepID=UPI0025D7EE43|nr:alpha/beta hydrolase [Noviherbaspirillum sp.]